jgi:hypothetical protein
VLGASLRLFNRRILKGEARGVEIRARELAADFGDLVRNWLASVEEPKLDLLVSDPFIYPVPFFS